eukprot:19182-Heterococcus_DN1.PRE.7
MARHLQLVEHGKRKLPQLESRLAAALAVLKSVSQSALNNDACATCCMLTSAAGVQADDDMSTAHSSIESLKRAIDLGPHSAESETGAHSVESVTAAVMAAEVAAHRHAGRAERAESARKIELRRLQTCQAHYNEVCTAVANYKARSDHLSSGAVEAEWQDIAYWRDVQLSPKSTATTAFNSNDGSSSSSATTTTADNSSAATTSASGAGASAHNRHARSSSFAFANNLTVSALLSQAQNCAEVRCCDYTHMLCPAEHSNCIHTL